MSTEHQPRLPLDVTPGLGVRYRCGHMIVYTVLYRAGWYLSEEKCPACRKMKSSKQGE